MDRQKKLIQDRPEKPQIAKPPAPRKRTFNVKDAPASPKKQKTPVKSAGPSKWLATIATQNWKSFAERIDGLQSKKRVHALKNMRLEWKRRIVLFSKIYRHKKFGDPDPFMSAQDIFED